MKHILLLGAGRSASVLIDYLLRYTSANGHSLTIADQRVSHIEPMIKSFSNVRALEFDIHNEEQRGEQVEQADLVISLLPASFHGLAARECLARGKHFLTASYV